MIAAETKEEVRQRTDLVKLVAETVRLARAGRSWKGCCPFHKERTPSFHVNPGKGRYVCYGCGEHGDAIDFVMKVEGLTFMEAVRSLAERAGITIRESGTEQDRREEAAKRRTRDDLFNAVRLAAVYYETQLREHPESWVARRELEDRGLDESDPRTAEAMAAFRVGYAPSGWDGLASFLRQQGVSPAVAEQAGLLLPRQSGSGYYDRFRCRLMFAVVDLQGRPVAFSGRILPDPKTGHVDTNTGKYVNSPETPIYKKGDLLFGLYQARTKLRDTDEAILVEGNFDVLSLHARGFTETVAPLGTAFTESQARLLKRFASKVTVFFDGDRSGQKAVVAARVPAAAAGLSVAVARAPAGLDPDAIARRRGTHGLSAILRGARGMLEHLIERELAGAAGEGAEERSARLARVVQLVLQEDDPVARALAGRYVDEAARRLGLFGPHADPSDPAYVEVARAVRAAIGSSSTPSAPPRAPAIDPALAGVIGPVIDVPAILDAPELRALLPGLPEHVVEALWRVAGASDPDLRFPDAPPPLAAFLTARSVVPAHDDPQEAATECVLNARKLAVAPMARPLRMPPLGYEEARAAAAAGMLHAGAGSLV